MGCRTRIGFVGAFRQMTSVPARSRLILLIIFVFALAWCFFLIKPYLEAKAGPTDAVESRLLDLRFVLAGTTPPAKEVVIVAIDDKTLAADDRAPLGTRDLLSRLITRIAESGARALAVDVLLTDAGSADGDAALANSLAMLPSVIAAAVVFDPNDGSAARLIRPHRAFEAAAQAGLVNLSTDATGVPRFLPLMINANGQLLPSLPMLAALTFLQADATFEPDGVRIADHFIPMDRNYSMPLRIQGPTAHIQTLSAGDLLDKPAPGALSGKIVMLGYTAAATGDRFATPFSDDTPGVEILAGAVSQIVSGDTLRRDAQTRLWDTAHAVVLTLAAVLAVCLQPLSRGLVFAAGFLALSLASVTLAFTEGIWLSAALPLAAATPPVIAAGLFRYGQERRLALKSERAVASLRRFQSPALARAFENDPEYLATPVERELVIFFVDLTGFTGLSQRLGTDGTRQLLVLFHKLTSDAIEACGGTVLNYMGDGALAVFGLSDNGAPDTALRARKAAFDLARTLSENQIQGRPEEGLRCRIGLHKGPATLSRLGAESHQQVTASGDTVNLASRLMEVAKERKAVIAASGDFLDALPAHARLPQGELLNVPVRGRQGEVAVTLWTTADVVAGNDTQTPDDPRTETM